MGSGLADEKATILYLLISHQKKSVDLNATSNYLRYELMRCFTEKATYIVGYKSFRPDIQKPHQMENAVRDI